MPTRSHALAALAAGAAVLAVPAAASARTSTVIAGPVKVKAYSMTLIASKNSMSAILTRRAGKSNQSHVYSASKGVKVKLARNLSSGSIKASLGKLGTVNLRLHGSGPVRKSKPPKGCTGQASRSRQGKLSGTFRLKADNGRYFGTIRQGSLPATALDAGKLTCQGTGDGGTGSPGGSSGSTTLSRTISDGDEFTSLVVTRHKGKVSEFVTRIDSRAATAPLVVTHSVSTTAPGGAFSVAGDLKSATVQGAGFITGSLSYAAKDGFGAYSTGTATGSLAARFDPLGKISLTQGDAPATLVKG
jgi:hypothetical protein